MEYGEFWLLEKAIGLWVPFRFVGGLRESLESQWNNPWHGMDRERLLDTLERLQTAGDIVIFDENDHTVVLSRNQFNEELTSGQRPPHAKVYGLTAKGGARWETFAKADWNRYHSFE